MIEGARTRTEIALHEAARRCAEAGEGDWERIVLDDLDDDATGIEPRTPRRAERATKKCATNEDRPRAPSPHTLTLGDRTIDLANGPLGDVVPLLEAQIFSPRSRGFLGVLDRRALVERELAGDLVIVVMIDLGGASQTLHADEARRWGAGVDLIELAIANAVAARAAPRRDRTRRARAWRDRRDPELALRAVARDRGTEDPRCAPGARGCRCAYVRLRGSGQPRAVLGARRNVDEDRSAHPPADPLAAARA